MDELVGGHSMRWASMARRVTVSLPIRCRSSTSTPARSSGRSSTCSRTRSNSRTRDARVSVSVDAEGGEVIVAVRTRESALPPEDLLTIFEPFQRGSSGSERPGAGLGLAIVRGFAQANRGRVWAESDGRGATFFLALPMAEAAVEIPT